MKKEDVVTGTRVRVSFDATVSHLSREIYNCVWVKADHGDSYRVQLKDCDVILPNFEVGDIVEWSNVGLIIQGSVTKWDSGEVVKNDEICISTLAGYIAVPANKCKIVRKRDGR